MDFRVGGKEVNAGCPSDGQMHFFNAVHQDIVPNRRIVDSPSTREHGTGELLDAAGAALQAAN